VELLQACVGKGGKRRREMILHCNYEELGALKQGASVLLGRGRGGGSPVAAPPEGRAEVEALLPRLNGDLTIETLVEQRWVARAIQAIVERLKEEMDLFIITSHPADESAVTSYFEYGHALAVLARVIEMGQEMEALIEVVTGAPPSPEVAKAFLFSG
jgi:hypothetical protein